jgi:hypothetical protein
MNMIWKRLDDGEDNITIFQKIHENYKPQNYIKENLISQIYKPTEVIIPYIDSKNFANKKTKRKKGRKLKNEISIIRPHERIHSRLNSDNIKRKIKTHYHNFIISLLNLTIKKEFNGVQKFKFKKMDSETTQNITINYNRNLLSTPIKDILKKVSQKFHDPLQNEKIISNIPSSKFEINKLLNCTYKEMYEDYYLKSRTDLFNEEKENNSFESHLFRIQNKFGNEYLKKYKENAENFIDFFINSKERKKQISILSNYKNNINKIDVNQNSSESSSTFNSSNSKFITFKERDE